VTAPGLKLMMLGAFGPADMAGGESLAGMHGAVLVGPRDVVAAAARRDLVSRQCMILDAGDDLAVARADVARLAVELRRARDAQYEQAATIATYARKV
jgi:hypothetical protein